MFAGAFRQDRGCAGHAPAVLALTLAMTLVASAAGGAEVPLTVAGLRVMPERWNKAANLEKFERYAARPPRAAPASRSLRKGFWKAT